MDMAMTEPATWKREYSKQSEMSCSWRSSPFAPFTKFGLATGSEMGTPPLEKRLRTEKMTVSTFKWEPDVPGNAQFSAGYGFKDVKVRTPLPAALQEQPSRGYSTPTQVRLSREKHEGVKQESMQRCAKLDNTAMLAEDALDKVGRPRIGLNSTLGPTQSFYQSIADAERELEDFKRVAYGVNSWVPLSSMGTSPAFSSLGRMRRRGSNLQQGPMNRDDVLAQNPVWKSWRSSIDIEIGALEEKMTRLRSERKEEEVRCQKVREASKKEEVLFKEDSQPNDELQAPGSGPESSSQPVAASIELLDGDDEAHVPKDDKEKESWHLFKKALKPVWKSCMSSKDREIEALQEELSRLRSQLEEDEVSRLRIQSEGTK